MNGPRKGLLLDFGGVISVTPFERHIVSEQALGLPAGTLTWRGPFDPAGDLQSAETVWLAWDPSADSAGRRVVIASHLHTGCLAERW